MSELTPATQIRPAHNSGCGEGIEGGHVGDVGQGHVGHVGQVIDVRREPNDSDALNGGSYVIFKLRSSKTKCCKLQPLT
jgi:hypothetical protein